MKERVRNGLVITGSIFFGLSYFVSLLLTVDKFDSNRAPYGALIVPVLGPLIVAGNIDQNEGLYVFDSLVQAGGAAMVLAGIFAKKKVFVRQDIVHVVRPEFLVGPGSIGMKLTF